MSDAPILTRHELADLRALANGQRIAFGSGNRLLELGLAVYMPFSGWQITFAGQIHLETESA
jgi:hypothetical protein